MVGEARAKRSRLRASTARSSSRSSERGTDRRPGSAGNAASRHLGFDQLGKVLEDARGRRSTLASIPGRRILRITGVPLGSGACTCAIEAAPWAS